jgi:hypothetical protein
MDIGRSGCLEYGDWLAVTLRKEQITKQHVNLAFWKFDAYGKGSGALTTEKIAEICGYPAQISNAWREIIQ